MSALSLTINHLGFKQYVDETDEYCCPNCELQYTNTGGGLICEQCGEDHEVATNIKEPA